MKPSLSLNKNASINLSTAGVLEIFMVRIALKFFKAKLIDLD